MNDIWIRSQYSAEELDGKSVEIKRERHNAIATFDVKSNGTGLLSIVVKITDTVREGLEWTDHRRPLPQEEADLIQPHPDQTVAAFLLVY